MSVNKVQLIGNVGKDPEKRTFDNGKSVVNLSLATSESWKDKAGVKQEKTEWHNLVFYSPLAEIVHKWIKKGSQIYVEGKLVTEMYEKDGVKHYPTRIVCRELQMLGKKDGAEPQKSAMDKVKEAGVSNQTDNIPEDDGELPF